ncbi:hypothetical protein AB0L13_47415 [Saccharopolyspora shandongensis]|uniref:hypothetical protein n=1 Tax=Saccharopolyspora shandongensis TaxID=418495 RepID=UPI0034401C4C
MGAGLGSGRGRLDPDAGESGGALVAGADVEAAEAALGELRAAGWPAPEDPDDGDDPELGGQDQVADRLSDEVDWLRQCAAWLTQLGTGCYPPVVNLPPIADWPATCNRAMDLARVAAVLERIAADVDELARARRVENLDGATVRGHVRAERRRRLAEPDLDFHTSCETTTLPTSSTPQLERAWEAWQAERYRRGETEHPPDLRDNPFRAR